MTNGTMTNGAPPSASSPDGRRLVEAALPYKELSLLVQRDRRLVDPVLAAHRWWARRPPALFRGLLLAAVLKDTDAASTFWSEFESSSVRLEGVNVYDAFAGGGTTLVEAARLGATPYGTDVDPIAVSIVRHALARPSQGDLKRFGSMLDQHLREKASHLYFDATASRVPIHYFYLRTVRCPKCGTEAPLYRDLVIARGIGKDGSVHRETAIEAFCPDCFAIHHYPGKDRKQLRCCFRRPLDEGTFIRGKFECPNCGMRSDHKELMTGSALRRLLAIEETVEDGSRQFRAPTERDLELLKESRKYVSARSAELSLPSAGFSTERIDRRPLSFGLTEPTQLFTDRQLAVFGHAFAWISQASVGPEVARALRLAMSQALTTNNLLCGYARDYGRLAPLFSVRSYALPILAVELNPFHPTGGRGTILRSLDRMSKSVVEDVTRHIWSVSAATTERRAFKFQYRLPNANVKCASAADASFGDTRFHIALFDPPYFDYIAYSELSEFYRAWWPDAELGGAPLLPTGDDAVRSFADSFGLCLRNTLKHVAAGSLVVFTFHSSSARAWEAVGLALDESELTVTAIWPVLADPHMGHHSSDGNCEWDLVIVTRPKKSCHSVEFGVTMSDWEQQLKPLRVGDADKLSMTHALAMVASRHGRYTIGENE